MATTFNTKSRILIAADSAANASLVKKLLEDEFGTIAISTNPERIVEEYQEAQPDVLVLAFNGMDKSQRYCLGLYRLGSEIQQRPIRIIMLCTKEEVRHAYVLCRDGLFDDYVLFWPVSNDAPRLLMAVHHATHELASMATQQPRAVEFLAQARRLAELETLLQERIAADDASLASTNTALKNTEHDISVALDGFSRRITSGGMHGMLEVKDAAGLKSEFAHFRREAISAPLEALTQSVQPLARQAEQFRASCTPYMESMRALSALADRVQPTLLVIDDDEFQCKLVAKALEAQNYERAFAHSGRDALAILRRLRPDLILLDVIMPLMDGIEMARQIRLVNWLANIPIIMLTGRSDKDTVHECLKAGAKDYIVKPFDRSTLVARVAHALGTAPTGT